MGKLVETGGDGKHKSNNSGLLLKLQKWKEGVYAFLKYDIINSLHVLIQSAKFMQNRRRSLEARWINRLFLVE